ncbi:MAG: hypothetical protein L0H79_14490 [Intrasporangium sp.]|uniref:hypothetical protein n=1 Tax=Intrasporangium sp. TaxID=1925024 RepID=UPI0026486A93|nr:hypothetical protein [Intrasporangium sp.]MDN5796950.1 hypothetical protein [Intrasporangium sp.]
MTTMSALHVSLSDVARLAGVQRPVASMWRKRPHEARPFPKPVAVIDGQDRFDAVEIADYLVATGRGNTRVEREDVAAHATLAGVPGLSESTVFTALSALLTLSVVTGEPLADLTSDDVLALAVGADPDDTHLRHEIEAVTPHLEALAAHADALADASYSVPAAFELLLRQHRVLPGRAAVALRDEPVDLVAQVAVALAAEADWDAPLFADVTDGSGDLLLKTLDGYAAEPAPSAATVPLDSPSARLLRRRLRVNDIHRVDVSLDDDADLTVSSVGFDGIVHVLQLPTPAVPSMSDLEVLDTIGDLLVQLADDSRVVVIGPASALTDRPADAATDRARDSVLRSDRLRAAIRLPAGLVVHSPRRHLALWALGPAHPDVPIAERWTVIGDLSDVVLDGAAIADVVTDVVASMTSPHEARTHSYRFARRVATATLIPGRRALVPNVIRKAAGDAHVVSLGAAVEQRLCRILPGNRVRPEDLLTHGRPVVGPAELLGEVPVGSRAVDPVTFPSAYPASRYTEPGDVVFCAAPSVAAWVDREGGAVVLSPAKAVRVARHTDATGPDHGSPVLHPDVLAADIANTARSATGESKDWRRWPIRLVSRDRHVALTTELDRITAERADLTAKLADLDAQAGRAIDEATRPREEGP